MTSYFIIYWSHNCPDQHMYTIQWQMYTFTVDSCVLKSLEAVNNLLFSYTKNAATCSTCIAVNMKTNSWTHTDTDTHTDSTSFSFSTSLVNRSISSALTSWLSLSFSSYKIVITQPNTSILFTYNSLQPSTLLPQLFNKFFVLAAVCCLCCQRLFELFTLFLQLHTTQPGEKTTLP